MFPSLSLLWCFTVYLPTWTLGPLLSCTNRNAYGHHHSPNPGASHIPVSQPDWAGCSSPVVASWGSIFSSDGLCAAGPQGSGPVGRPQQHHQCQSEWNACARAAKGNDYLFLIKQCGSSVCCFYNLTACKLNGDCTKNVWYLMISFFLLNTWSVFLSGLQLWSKANVS